jgi:hypothetical protein
MKGNIFFLVLFFHESSRRRRILEKYDIQRGQESGGFTLSLGLNGSALLSP